MSERRAVRVLGAHRSAMRYRPKRPRLDAPIRKRIEEIAAVRIRYGYRRIHILLQREGWRVNSKRVYRIYCLADSTFGAKDLGEDVRQATATLDLTSPKQMTAGRWISFQMHSSTANVSVL